MKNINKFAMSEMTEDQENQYVESLYNVHYNNKLRSKYTSKLEKEYDVKRSSNKEGNLDKQKNTKIRNLFISVASIAAILVFVLFAMPMINGGNEAGPQQMALSMIKIEKIEVQRGVQDDAQVRRDIVDAFNKEDWSQTVNLFATVEGLKDVDYYHLGLAHLASENYQDAEAAFNKISSPDTFRFSVEYNWYRGLNKVLLNKHEEAKVYLNKVVLSTWMSEKAQLLLDKIK